MTMMVENHDHKMINDLGDKFPVGMRVLAVDNDQISLKFLETLLQKCQYHVTTAINAVAALNLLRENKNNFDLIISDAHMPDMDGFQLLDLVRLEMDLPIILLSANDDPKMVMKGIAHGAADYLLKPVRINELHIIWQHVIRKKMTTTLAQNENPSKKRKICDEEKHDNDHEDEDPTASKKARVAWSIELHHKFLAAVEQLGIDKAVPRKILQLMNVQKLTRENVASHLQKYRNHIKRKSCVANQQPGMVVAAAGSEDTQPSHYSFSSLENGSGNDIWSSSMQPATNSYSFSSLENGRCNDILSSSMQLPATNSYSFSSLENGRCDDIWSSSMQQLDATNSYQSHEQISSNVAFQEWDNHNQDGIYDDYSDLPSLLEQDWQYIYASTDAC